MYAAVRRARSDPASVDEVARRIETGFVPIMRTVPGFQEYFLVATTSGEFMSVSVFEDQAAAEESNSRAREWVRQNLVDLIQESLETLEGEIKVHATME